MTVSPSERVHILPIKGDFTVYLWVLGEFSHLRIGKIIMHGSLFTPGRFFRGNKLKSSSSYGILSPSQHFSAKLGKISIVEETRRRPFLSLQDIPIESEKQQIAWRKIYYMKLSFLFYFCRIEDHSPLPHSDKTDCIFKKIFGCICSYIFWCSIYSYVSSVYI